MSFAADRARGGEGEELVFSLLDRAGTLPKYNEQKSVEGLRGWDVEFRLNHQKYRVEVKHDFMAAKTGKLAVEYLNCRSGRPSGILATRSDLWAFVLERQAWLARTKDLRTYFDCMPCVKDVARAGDGNSSLRLYSRDELLGAVFCRVDLLSPAELVRVLVRLTTPGVGRAV